MMVIWFDPLELKIKALTLDSQKNYTAFNEEKIYIGSLLWLGSRDLRLATFREIHLPSSGR